MPNETYLFVYGTLRKTLNHPMHQMFARHATFKGKGTFQGKLYDLGRYPGAVPSASNADRVTGECYRIKDTMTVFEALDEYEGKLFRREPVRVRLETGVEINAVSYLYTGPTAARLRIDSGDYVVFLQHR